MAQSLRVPHLILLLFSSVELIYEPHAALDTNCSLFVIIIVLKSTTNAIRHFSASSLALTHCFFLCQLHTELCQVSEQLPETLMQSLTAD